MTTENRQQRMQEIVWELRAACDYFERLIAEIERDPSFKADGNEIQTAQTIYQNVSLLQWRFELNGYYMPDSALSRLPLPEQSRPNPSIDFTAPNTLERAVFTGKDNA